MLGLAGLATLVREDQRLGSDVPVAGLAGPASEGHETGVDQLVALDRSALVVEDDDRAAFAGVRKLAEPRVPDPVLKAAVMCETTGQRPLARLGPTGQFLDDELAAVGVLLELDHVLVDLQAADFGDLLDHHAVELERRSGRPRGQVPAEPSVCLL